MKFLFLMIIVFIAQKNFAQTNVFPASGNVGIGTPTPAEKMHVRGNVRLARESGGNNYILFTSDSDGNYMTADDPTTNQKNLLLRVAPTGENATDRHLYFQTGKVNGVFQTRLFIHGNGNVGVGTTNPTSKLAVNGTIRAKEIKVESANWPDYVFNENYNLMPLNDLKSFIDEHKHLPDIPTAPEVKEEGIALGEMNRKLLEKIEELTLHVIRQQEELNNIKSQLETIKTGAAL